MAYTIILYNHMLLSRWLSNPTAMPWIPLHKLSSRSEIKIVSSVNDRPDKRYYVHPELSKIYLRLHGFSEPYLSFTTSNLGLFNWKTLCLTVDILRKWQGWLSKTCAMDLGLFKINQFFVDIMLGSIFAFLTLNLVLHIKLKPFTPKFRTGQKRILITCTKNQSKL